MHLYFSCVCVCVCVFVSLKSIKSSTILCVYVSVCTSFRSTTYRICMIMHQTYQPIWAKPNKFAPKNPVESWIVNLGLKTEKKKWTITIENDFVYRTHSICIGNGYCIYGSWINHIWTKSLITFNLSSRLININKHCRFIRKGHCFVDVVGIIFVDDDDVLWYQTFSHTHKSH